MENDAVVEVGEKSVELSRRERRRLGITLWGIRSANRTLKVLNDEYNDYSKATRCIHIAEYLMSKHPQAYRDVCGDRDWEAFLEAVLAFIEKLLAILQLFALI